MIQRVYCYLQKFNVCKWCFLGSLVMFPYQTLNVLKAIMRFSLVFDKLFALRNTSMHHGNIFCYIFS